MESTAADLTTDLPTVTVVIPVFNGVDLLAGCLRAVANQTYPSHLVKVLVVDNNSAEDVASVMPHEARFTLLHESRRGSYAARNAALARATGTVIAFTDADCSPHADWLEEGVRALGQEPRAAMVGGRIALVYEHGRPRTGCELYESTYSFRQDWYLSERRFAATANVLTWRDTLDWVGTFDATLMSRGDAQWGQRVAAAGGLQRYASQAIVDHPARATWSELMTKQRRVAEGQRRVDLVDDPRLRHFAGLAKTHLQLMVTEPLTIWSRQPADSFVGTMRFLVVFIAVRIVLVDSALRGIGTLLRVRLTQRRRR